MSKIKQQWIDEFYLENERFLFMGAHVFSDENKSMLIGKDGYTIILDDELLNNILNKEISNELMILLSAHKIGVINADNTEMTKKVKARKDFIAPVFFMIDLTNRCNLACKYCLRDGYNSITAKVMSEQTVENVCDYIIKYCNQTGEYNITVQPWGGEPLLELKKIFMIQDKLIAAGINVCITIETNGILLCDKTIEELKRRNIWVSVSIDGPGHIHDSQRSFENGKPSHSVVERNLKKLLEAYSGNVSVIATLTKKTYPYITKIIDYLYSEMGIRNIKMNFVHKSSFVDNDALCMSEDEIGRATATIFDTMMDLAKDDKFVADYNIYTKFMNLLYRQREDVCLCDGCHGGRKMITFDYKGDIYPCDVSDYQEECIGNIYENEDLINTVSKAMDCKTYFLEKGEEKCLTCPWSCYCKGGCTVHVKTNGDNPPKVDKIECAINKVLYPRLVETILERPELVNKFLHIDIL